MRYLLIGLLGLLTLGAVYSCKKELSVEYGTGAKGSLQSSAGDCLPKSVGGSYVAAKSLNDSNYIDVTVDVASTGPYKIFTDTVNGYAFTATGTFSNTGTNTVRLKGGGQPETAGTDDFTVYFDSSFCDVNVVVLPAGGSSCASNVQGTYTAGTALTAANKVTFTHTYATAGNYTVSTSTANGYSFGPSSYTATAGSNTITLTATGTPTTAGTNNFTVNFGDGQTCSFTVTVAGVANTDYFPTTLNSYWTYDDGAGADTFKLTVTGPINVNVFSGPGTSTSTTYQKFTYSGYYSGDDYYRKDAAGNYFQFYDTTGYGIQGATFNQPNFEIRFLQNSLTVGATWNSDVTNVTLGATPGLTLRFAFTRVADNGSVTVNGKTYTNIYKIQLQLKAGTGTAFQNLGTPYNYYYAKGVGLVLVEDSTGTPIQAVRYWQVN